MLYATMCQSARPFLNPDNEEKRSALVVKARVGSHHHSSWLGGRIEESNEKEQPNPSKMRVSWRQEACHNHKPQMKEKDGIQALGTP
jgi:hypothetical protein